MPIVRNGKFTEAASEEIKEALKETLVITTGDNYVGSAEPQLREKIANLYAKLASSYDVPSQAELDNLAALEKRFKRAKTDILKNSKARSRVLQQSSRVSKISWTPDKGITKAEVRRASQLLFRTIGKRLRSVS